MHCERHIAFLPAIAFGTLFQLFILWAAIYDIAIDDADSVRMHTSLVLSTPTFGLLWALSSGLLPRKPRTAWLVGTGLLMIPIAIMALKLTIIPRHPSDAGFGLLLLVAGLPLFGGISFTAIHAIRRRRDARS